MHDVLHLGLIVIFGIIMLPVYVMIAGWLVGKPRDYWSVTLAFGYVLAFVVVTVAALFLLDVAISLFVPY